jgi:hypothetical protein
MKWHRRGKAISSMLVVVAVIAQYDKEFREMVLTCSPYSIITVSFASLLDGGRKTTC